jgi:hypothetical protein
MSRRYGDAYDERFVSRADGHVGDLAATRDHHHSYGTTELAALLAASGFDVIARTGSGFLGRPIDGIRLLTSGRLRRMLDRVVLADGRWFRRAHLFALCHRR